LSASAPPGGDNYAHIREGAQVAQLNVDPADLLQTVDACSDALQLVKKALGE
jgi:hypothetical protein